MLGRRRGRSSEEDPPRHLVEYCAKTPCDAERDRCEAQVDSCNASCLNASLDSFESCYAVCRNVDCPSCVGGEGPCLAMGYTFALDADAD